jgi:hypothetical protein
MLTQIDRLKFVIGANGIFDWLTYSKIRVWACQLFCKKFGNSDYNHTAFSGSNLSSPPPVLFHNLTRCWFVGSAGVRHVTTCSGSYWCLCKQIALGWSRHHWKCQATTGISCVLSANNFRSFVISIKTVSTEFLILKPILSIFDFGPLKCRFPILKPNFWLLTQRHFRAWSLQKPISENQSLPCYFRPSMNPKNAASTTAHIGHYYCWDCLLRSPLHIVAINGWANASC